MGQRSIKYEAMIRLKVNEQLEVSETIYLVFKRRWAGVIAHRYKDGRYYIKILVSVYADQVKRELNQIIK